MAVSSLPHIQPRAIAREGAVEEQPSFCPCCGDGVHDRVRQCPDIIQRAITVRYVWGDLVTVWATRNQNLIDEIWGDVISDLDSDYKRLRLQHRHRSLASAAHIHGIGTCTGPVRMPPRGERGPARPVVSAALCGSQAVFPRRRPAVRL